jgi:hypothetical protein
MDIFLLVIEKEFYNKDTNRIIPHYFPLGFHYILENISKTRQFYDFILVDTNSIKITHNQDKNNPQKINYSKLKILNVLTYQD